MSVAGRASPAIAAVLLSGAFGACANGAELALPGLPGADAADASSATFLGQRLGTRRQAVLDSLATVTVGHAEPRCTFARLAPANGARRAFPIERCEHAVTGGGRTAPTLAGRTVTAIVTHFVDDRLARLDVRTISPRTGDDGLAGLRSGLDERFGKPRPADGVDARRVSGGAVVELAGTSPARLSLIDGEVLAVLPGLGEDDPTATAD